jgi:hypothetical protein
MSVRIKFLVHQNADGDLTGMYVDDSVVRRRADAYTNTDPDCYADGDANSYCNSYSYGNRDGNPDCYADGNANSYCNGYSDGNPNGNGDRDGRSYGNANSYCNGNRDGKPDCYADGDANGYSYGNRDGHGYGNANSYCNGYTDGYANTDAKATQAYADAKAADHAESSAESMRVVQE